MFEKYIVAAAFFDHIAERAHATIVLGFGLQSIYQDKVMLLQWWDVIGFHWHGVEQAGEIESLVIDEARKCHATYHLSVSFFFARKPPCGGSGRVEQRIKPERRRAGTFLIILARQRYRR